MAMLLSFLSKPAFKIQCLVFVSGLAALSWEVIWQIKSTLALGVSAWGTALTLAITMGCISVGSIAMGRFLKNKEAKPARLYGMLEAMIGAFGLALIPAFQAIETLDTTLYTLMPDYAPLFYMLGIVATLGIPAMCMGATLPVLGLTARQFQTSISTLYMLNTLGAAVGTLLVAFLLIPALGISHAIWLVAAINMAVGAAAWALGRSSYTVQDERKADTGSAPQFSLAAAGLVVFVTGFATFSLEVSWFRSLTASFQSTTDAFAIMLSCVLLSLGAGAALSRRMKKRQWPLGILLSVAGIFVLLATPLIERFDYIVNDGFTEPYVILLTWFFATLGVVAIPVTLLGVALPWILDDQHTPRKWGMLYGLNTVSSVAGALCAGWILLPTVGFAQTAWIAGVAVVTVGILTQSSRRGTVTILAMLALFTAISFESGVGKTRIQSQTFHGGEQNMVRVLKAYEGPDATVSVAELDDGGRSLVINGFIATSQLGEATAWTTHYMAWMGHMPMLLHPSPKKALVICFGTGQTANAVRRENPTSLDIVDINKEVIKLAPFFSTNEGVLDDARVRTTVMDGRAFIRRAREAYDVITLEPMPPTFAGVNALYSQEFYQAAHDKLGPDGVIAQWLPFHLVPANYSLAIAKTFQSVFPNSILWIDPASSTGILLGSKNHNGTLGATLPGFSRAGIKRDLSEQQVKDAILFNKEGLQRYAKDGQIITDDNQLLAYGQAVYQFHSDKTLNMENQMLLAVAKREMR